jgi:flagellar motor switch/type III secretory pathway protein FliN
VIAALHFGAPRAASDGRSVRPALFALRSTLPLSAASVVANGAREQLSRLLARECDVEVVAPIVPGSDERRVLLDGALVRRVRGRRADAFVIVRPADAARLAALAFGEGERSRALPLSELERETLERVLGALVPLCSALCGTLGPATPQSAEGAAADLATYFEVRTIAEPRIAIGFGLSLDPPEEVGPTLTLEDLADVELDLHVRFAAGSLAVPHFARLARGAVLALETQLGAASTLRAGGIALARGEAGASAGSCALRVAAQLAR